MTLLRSYLSHTGVKVLRGLCVLPVFMDMDPVGSLKAETGWKLGFECRLWPWLVGSLLEVWSLSHYIEKGIEEVQFKGASGMWLGLSLEQ